MSIEGRASPTSGGALRLGQARRAIDYNLEQRVSLIAEGVRHRGYDGSWPEQTNGGQRAIPRVDGIAASPVEHTVTGEKAKVTFEPCHRAGDRTRWGWPTSPGRMPRW